MKLTFLGAAHTVTGSKFLLEQDNLRVLIDCGLFQGGRSFETKNKFNIIPHPKDINAILLTHAHIDHSGYIPVLIKKGFKGKIYCTEGTYDLCSILLPDSGHLQEEHAFFLRKKGFNIDAQPLYTADEGKAALQYFKIIDYNKTIELSKNFSFSFTNAGHIFGSSCIQIHFNQKIITFSGDLGRPNDFFMKPPEFIQKTDYLLMESTYGDKKHSEDDIKTRLEQIIKNTIKKGGAIIIPAFAVGRTQGILYLLSQLKQEKRIPQDFPIFVDSPMAIATTTLMCKYKSQHKIENCQQVNDVAQYIRDVEDSKKLDTLIEPRIIITASGMISGGRVLFHVKNLIENPQNTLLFVGYQSINTLGRKIEDGEKNIQIFGHLYHIKANIEEIHLSAHADALEILDWIDHIKEKPKQIFLTHGDNESMTLLEQKIHEKFPKIKVITPKLQDSFELD